MQEVMVMDVKKGDYVTLKAIENPKESQVYVRCEYDRATKSYYFSRFDDVNCGRFIKGDRLVYVGFTF